MRRSFQKLIGRGRYQGIKVQATFSRISPSGHILFKNVVFSEGREDHLWVNRRSADMIPALHEGDKIKFFADIWRYRTRDGGENYGVRDIREVSLLEAAL